MVTIENTLKNEISIFSCAPFKEKSKNFCFETYFWNFFGVKRTGAAAKVATNSYFHDNGYTCLLQCGAMQHKCCIWLCESFL